MLILPRCSYFKLSSICKLLALVFAGVACFQTAVFAATDSIHGAAVAEFSWIPLLMGLFGGLALFLYGMDQMSSGLKSAAGEKMKDILSRFTSNRVKAALTGSMVTAVIQSSSVTTVLVVGFVSAGIMTLSQSVGVVMGANVGTTLTAQIVAFKVQNAALALIAVGFALLFIGKRDAIKQLGNVFMGLGLVFLGMTLMSDGMNPLRNFEPFLDFMITLRNPLLGILVGAVFTGLVQSSSATTGIVIALASQGLIELPTGVSLIFGANIGTCFTALLATLGKGRESLQVALVHVIFNVVGVAIWFGFIPQLVDWVRVLSPSAEGLSGTMRLAEEVPRQIANAHAIFNVTNTLLLLPFTTVIASLVKRMAPIKERENFSEPEFLDEAVLSVPAMALNNARLEIARMGERVCEIVQRVPDALARDDELLLKEIHAMDDPVDDLQEVILHYIGRIRKMDLSDSSSDEIQRLIIMADALERIGDVVTGDIVAICQRRMSRRLHMGPQALEMLQGLHKVLENSMSEVVTLMRIPDPDGTIKVVERKAELDQRLAAVFRHQEKRFGEESSNRVQVFRIEMDIVEKQRRIFTLIQRIAEQL